MYSRVKLSQRSQTQCNERVHRIRGLVQETRAYEIKMNEPRCAMQLNVRYAQEGRGAQQPVGRKDEHSTGQGITSYRNAPLLPLLSPTLLRYPRSRKLYSDLLNFMHRNAYSSIKCLPRGKTTAKTLVSVVLIFLHLLILFVFFFFTFRLYVFSFFLFYSSNLRSCIFRSTLSDGLPASFRRQFFFFRGLSPPPLS